MQIGSTKPYSSRIPGAYSQVSSGAPRGTPNPNIPSSLSAPVYGVPKAPNYRKRKYLVLTRSWIISHLYVHLIFPLHKPTSVSATPVSPPQSNSEAPGVVDPIERL